VSLNEPIIVTIEVYVEFPDYQDVDLGGNYFLALHTSRK